MSGGKNNRQSRSLDEMLEELQRKIAQRKLEVEDVDLLKNIHEELDKKWRYFEQMLIAAKNMYSGDSGKSVVVSEIDSILHERKPERVSELMERLRRGGWRVTNTIIDEKNIDPDKVGLAKILYRVVEQTRMRNRSQVFYLLVRALIAEGVAIPKELVDAFKPIYNDEEFASMIYAFITGIQQRIESRSSNNPQLSEETQNQ